MNPITAVMNWIKPIRFDGDNIPLWNRLEYSLRDKLLNGMITVLLVLIMLAILLPLYWMLSTALTPRAELFDFPVPLFPDNPTLDHFWKVIANSNFLVWYMNSLVVAIGVVLLTVFSATLGGYGLARLELPYKKTYARTILFGYMFPPILLAIPMFIFWRQLNIVNSHVGLILAETAISLPFSLWLMWQNFQRVPNSLEESALMAGATRFRAFVDIALPIAKPGMVAVGVFSFAVSWNQFTIPQVLMIDANHWVVVQGLFSFSKQHSILWGQLMAACFIVIIPPFLFVFFLQKYLLQGFRTGGVK